MGIGESRGKESSMKEQKDPKKPFIYYCIIALAGLILVNVFLLPALTSSYTAETVTYDRFLEDLEGNKITEVVISQSDQAMTC